MKKLNILLIFAFSLLQISCEEDDVFTGQPDPAVLEFITLTGSVASTDDAVVSAQPFSVTVTIPQTFDVDVNVEVTAFLPNINKRSRKVFTIEAGETSIEGKMNAPGADQGQTTLPFNQNMEVYLSAITTTPVITADGLVPSGFAGKQYRITSNKLNLDYGDSAFGGVNANRLSVRLDWKNPAGGGIPNNNNLNIVLKRDGVVTAVSPSSQTTLPIHGTTVSTGRYEFVNFLSTAIDGTYVFEVFAQKLVSPGPIDIPFRFTVRFPDETVKTFSRIWTGVNVGTAATAVPKFQVIKSTVDGQANYVVSVL